MGMDLATAAGTIGRPKVGPMLEQFAGGALQALPKPLRPLIAGVDQPLKIAFQMRPAPLQPLHAPVHFGPITGDHPTKLLTRGAMSGMNTSDYWTPEVLSSLSGATSVLTRLLTTRGRRLHVATGHLLEKL